MEPNVVDGYRWTEARLKFLRDRLNGNLSDDDRRVIESEIDALSRTEPLGCTGPSFPPAWLPALLRRTSASAPDEDQRSMTEADPDSPASD